MDRTKINNYTFDFKVVRFVGIFQMIAPGNPTVFGYNVYHVIFSPAILLMTIQSLSCLFYLYYLNKDELTIVYYIGSGENLFFSCYKIMTIMACSKEIWKLLDIASLDFMKYGHYDRMIFKQWRRSSTRALIVFIFVAYFASFSWMLSPCVFNETKISMKYQNVTYLYRMNILNINFMISDEIYNNHFNVFYFMEAVSISCFAVFNALFDILIIILCSAISCQLDTICKALELLGHDSTNSNLGK